MRKKRGRVLEVWLDPDLVDLTDRTASALGISRSELLRSSLIHYLGSVLRVPLVERGAGAEEGDRATSSSVSVPAPRTKWGGISEKSFSSVAQRGARDDTEGRGRFASSISAGGVRT